MNDKKYKKIVQTHKRIFLNDDSFPIKIILVDDLIREWQETKRQELLEKKDPPQWADIGVILDDPYIIVLRDLVEFPDGRLGGYFRVINRADLEGGKSVAILPVFNNKILLQHQFRHATRAWHYEIPRGFGEPNISAEENAHKEIGEETGGKIKNLIPLGLYHSNTGLDGNDIHLFFAELESIGEPDINEGIENFHLVTTEELEEMIRSEKITDGFTIAAYTRAKLRGLI